MSCLIQFQFLPASQNQDVTLTSDFNFPIPGGGGVHQPEPKCHIDLRFTLSHSWGGGWGGGGGWNLRSMWHFSSGWCTPGYIRSHSNFLQVFQSWNEMLIFGLCSTSDDQPGWSMDLNPICHPSPAKKVKCSFLDYIQLLMISRAIPAMKVNQNVTKGPLSHQKMKYLFL